MGDERKTSIATALLLLLASAATKLMGADEAALGLFFASYCVWWGPKFSGLLDRGFARLDKAGKDG